MSSPVFYSFVLLVLLMGIFVVMTAHKIHEICDKMNKLHHRIANLDHTYGMDEKHRLEFYVESQSRLDALEAKNKILLKFLNTSWTEVLKDTAPKISIQEAIDAHFTEDEAEVPNDVFFNDEKNGDHWYKKGFMD